MVTLLSVYDVVGPRVANKAYEPEPVERYILLPLTPEVVDWLQVIYAPPSIICEPIFAANIDPLTADGAAIEIPVTVNVTALLVTEPTLLLTTHSYSYPFRAVDVVEIVYVALVAWLIVVQVLPLFILCCH